ncbi:MAG: response regulator [Chitinophagaceae bacterium]
MIPNLRPFIVIDDNKLDCFIAEKIIFNTGLSDDIKTFTDAQKALKYIEDRELPEQPDRCIIIVDIQMPLMNGFEFVEAFERLPLNTQKNYDIYVLSSTINENDLNRVRNYKTVKHLLDKPLTSKKLSYLIERLLD